MTTMFRTHCNGLIGDLRSLPEGTPQDGDCWYITAFDAYCFSIYRDGRWRAQSWGEWAYRKVCSCPSGDGSLRWPCPVHPPC